MNKKAYNWHYFSYSVTDRVRIAADFLVSPYAKIGEPPLI